MKSSPDNELFVGNLNPIHTDDELLHLAFSYFGTVKSTTTIHDRNIY